LLFRRNASAVFPLRAAKRHQDGALDLSVTRAAAPDGGLIASVLIKPPVVHDTYLSRVEALIEGCSWTTMSGFPVTEENVLPKHRNRAVSIFPMH